MERVERCGSVSHWLLRYLQQGGVAFLTYPAHLCVANGEAARLFPGLAHTALCASSHGYKWSCPVPSFFILFSRTGLCDTNGLQPGRVCFSSGLPACAECCGEAGVPWYRVWLSLEALCRTQLHPPDSGARHCAASPGAGGDKAVRCVMDTIGVSSVRSETG